MADMGDYKSVSAGINFDAGQIDKAVGGPYGQAWAENTANLLGKIQDGTATPDDITDADN